MQLIWSYLHTQVGLLWNFNMPSLQSILSTKFHWNILYYLMLLKRMDNFVRVHLFRNCNDKHIFTNDQLISDSFQGTSLLIHFKYEVVINYFKLARRISISFKHFIRCYGILWQLLLNAAKLPVFLRSRAHIFHNCFAHLHFAIPSW